MGRIVLGLLCHRDVGVALCSGDEADGASPRSPTACELHGESGQVWWFGGCDGATQPLGFAYTETTGLSLEASYPYTAQTGTCDTSKIAPVVTNTGLVQLPTNNYTALIGAVATVGPVSISVAAGSFGWQLYFGGVYTGSCDYDMDHAVQLVGYGEDSGKLYWLVRNSWGSGWGESGYIRMERFGEGSEPCGTDSTPTDGDAILRQVRHPLCVQLPYRRERSVGLGGSVTLSVNMFFARETLA